jgi:hypothetical protein
MLLRAVGLGISPVFNARLTIASAVNNYNLSVALQSLGWTAAKRARVEVTINSGVTVGSIGTGSPAFLVNLKDIDYVTIINNGNIFGAGGAGGGSYANSNGYSGSGGGTALQAISNVRVVNNGIIGGGGGGGGGAGASQLATQVPDTPPVTASCPAGWTYQPGYATCGRCVLYGPMGMVFNIMAAGCTYHYKTQYSYPAGASGVAGTDGSGAAGAAGASPYYTGGAGGAAGYYYQGSNKITVITAGTTRGTIVA